MDITSIPVPSEREWSDEERGEFYQRSVMPEEQHLFSTNNIKVIGFGNEGCRIEIGKELATLKPEEVIELAQSLTKQYERDMPIPKETPKIAFSVQAIDDLG